MTLSAGARLGPYEILTSLGAGGMGEVWKAKDTRLDRFVAVKVLPEHLAKHPESLARFEREAKGVAALNHPNITGIHDFATQGGTTYVVMELLEGESLRSLLERGPVSPRKATELAIQMAHGLAAAHEKGVVHRDLKPDNLWITKEGRLKILDFGLAKQLPTMGSTSDSLQPTAAVSPGHHTEKGMILGTLGYMSPEQVRGEAVDARSDLFSFGVVLFEMLTGKKAFARDTASDTMAAILRDDPPELEGNSRPIPLVLRRIIDHCLEKAPTRRFRDAHDVAFALENLSSSDGPAPIPAPFAPHNRRNKALLAAGSVALSLMLILVGWALKVGSPPPTFKRLTFFRGTVDRGGFANHGQTIVYSARVDGQDSSLYSLSLGSAEPTQLGPPGTHLLSVSDRNELLVLRNPLVWGGRYRGNMAQATQAGTGLREVGERVFMADWLRGSQEFALGRTSDRDVQSVQVEFPSGRAVYETSDYLSQMRSSPDGKRILFLENSAVPGGSIRLRILSPDGKVVTLANSPHVGSAVWASTGREIWLAELEGDQTTLSKISLSGSRIILWRGAGSLVLQEVDPEGRLLVSLQQTESQAETPGDDPAFPRNLNWLGSTFAFALTRDGRGLLFNESNSGGGNLDGVYLRRAGERAPVRLGAGYGSDLSPDGRMVLASNPDGQFRLIPTGAGAARKLDTGPGIGAAGWFFPDGRKVLLDKSLPDGTSQMVIADLEQGGVRNAAPAGFTAFTGQRPLSPDGTRMALWSRDSKTDLTRFMVFTTDGEERIPVTGVLPTEVLQAWTEDGRGLYVFDRTKIPVQITRVDIATGRREPWKKFVPADPAGIRGITNFEMTRDGKRVVFNYKRVLSQLYLVEGLK